MSEVNIFRPITDAEKQDFNELGQTNILEVFMAKLADKRTECQKSYKPFDGYSARQDFEEQIRKLIGDASTVIDPKLLAKKKVNIPNLDVYAEADRFDLVSADDVFADKLVDGMRNTVKIGKNFNYKAKARGNGITVFVPKEDLDVVEKRKKE